MFNLNDIVQSAQGGQAINNLAQRFGLSPEQAQAAVQSLIPALSHGLQQTVQTPGGMGDILASLTNAQHHAAYKDADAAQESATTDQGGKVVGQIFGDQPQVAAQVAQHAAQHSGISPEILQSMLPVVASLVMGGLFHSMQGQGMGGMLGQISGSAMGQGGSLGQILGQVMGGATMQNQAGASPPAQGGLGGLLGSLLGGGAAAGGLGGLLGNLLGGGQATPGAPGAAGNMPQSQAIQAGIDMLSKMFQPGTAVSGSQQQGLNDILGQLTAPRR